MSRISDRVKRLQEDLNALCTVATNEISGANQIATKAGADAAELRQTLGRERKEAAERVEAAVRAYADRERELPARLAKRIRGDWRGKTFKDVFLRPNRRGGVEIDGSIEPFVNEVLSVMAEAEQRHARAKTEAPAEQAAETAAPAETTPAA